MTALTHATPRLDPRTKLGEGGFGSVYSLGGGRCVKWFRTPLNGDAQQTLRHLDSIEAWARPSDVAVLRSRFAWPTELLFDGDELVGYVMPQAPESAHFELRTADQVSRVFLQAKYLINATYWTRAAVQSAPPTFVLQDRVEATIDLHQALVILHENDLAHGDLSANNVCFTLGRQPRAFVLDADSIMPATATPSAGTADWEVSVEGAIFQERARLALLCWRLFVEQPTSRPTDADEAWPTNFAPQLKRALVTCYVDGSAESFASIGDELRAVLEPARRARLVATALQYGWARAVVRQGEAAVEAELLAAAVSQIDIELRCELATGARRRVALDRLARHAGRFKPDVRPIGDAAAAPSSTEELQAWILDARFDEITSALIAGEIEPAITHSWLSRAVAHAHLCYQTPRLEQCVLGDRVELAWQWPLDARVNVATLSLDHGMDTIEIAVDRTGAGRAVQVVGMAPGSVVLGVLRMGSRAPGGEIHVGSARFTTEIFGPPQIVGTNLSEPAASTGSDERPAVWLPPDVPPAVAPPLVHRRRRRRFVVATGIVTLLLLVLVAGVYWMNREGGGTTIVNGPVTINLDESMTTVTWTADAERYRVEFQHLATEWADVEIAELDQAAWTVTAPTGVTHTRFRVIALDERDHLSIQAPWTTVTWPPIADPLTTGATP